MMKLIPFFMVTMLMCMQENILAQEQITLARFVIQDARLNDSDVTGRYVKANAYLVMYETPDKTMSFAVIMDKENTQTFGSVFDVKDVEKTPETEEQYRTEVYNFRWSYKNKSTLREGTARVRLTKIFKPYGVMFTAVIFPDDLEVMKFKGYMEGSLDVDKD